jgi:probable HAF family extracellular repeat protein
MSKQFCTSGNGVSRAIASVILSLMFVACSGTEVTPVAPVVHVARVDITAPFQVVESGTVLNVIATVTDATGIPIRDRDVTWSSSDPTVAKVTSTGRLSAAVTGETPGTVTISAAVESVTGSITLGTIPAKLNRFTAKQAFFYSDDDGIFKIPDLPGATLSYASGISDAGFVVGTALIAGEEHGFLWRADMEPTDIGMLPGATRSFATAVNDSAEVVGYSLVAVGPGSASPDARPFRWTRARGMVGLTLPAGAFGGAATGVNNAGEVSGWASYIIGNEVGSRPVRWSGDGAVEELAIPSGGTEGEASGINGDGDIVGYASDGYYYFAEVRAVIWRHGAGPFVIDGCGTECQVDAHSISDDGKVAGIRQDHAFVWSESDGIVDFPSLPGAQYSEARGVNNAGEVAINTFYPAGPRASIAFAPGNMHDLGVLPGKSYTTAVAMNNTGKIVGFAQ